LIHLSRIPSKSVPSSESSLIFQEAFSSFFYSFFFLSECPAYSERELWDACTSGDLDLVKQLVSDSEVKVNWEDPEYHRTAFFRACFFGHPSIVEFLLKHPKVEVNKIQKEGATPFLSACCNGHSAVVSLLWLT